MRLLHWLHMKDDKKRKVHLLIVQIAFVVQYSTDVKKMEFST